MKKTFKIALAFALSLSAGNALAAASWANKPITLTTFGVSQWNDAANTTIGFLEGPLNTAENRPTTGTCAGSSSTQAYFDLGSDKGRSLFATVQSAFLAGKAVRIEWAGTCSNGSGAMVAKVAGLQVIN